MDKGEPSLGGGAPGKPISRAPAPPIIRKACTFVLAAQATLLLIAWFNRTQGDLVWWPSDDMGRFIADLLLWPIHDPLHWGINLAIVLMLLWLLAAVTGRMRLSVVMVAEFYLALGIINHVKMMHLGMPVSIGDISFVAFAVRFMLKSWGIPPLAAWIPVAAIAGLCVWCWRRRKPPTISPGRRALWGTGGIVIALLLVLTLHSNARNAIGLTQQDARAQSHLRRHQEIGLSLTLALELVPGPADLTDPLSDQEIEQLAANVPAHMAVAPSATPHVIFWLSESFWDPTLMGNIRIEPDPLANYRRLSGEGRGFNLLVPTFGGFTSRTMFEMVTGFTNAYVPAGLDAFTHIVSTTPFPSLARLFSFRGYDTVAIRAGLGDLFAGKEAYAMLGFDHYDTEDDMPHAARVRGYVTDQALSEYVVRRVESSPKPMFVFLASIQNHAPFEPSDYEHYHVRVFDPTLRIVDGPMMSYIEGVYEADQALAYLLERFEQDDVPVVVVFYGDHLPGFVNEFAAAKLFPPGDPMSLEELRRKYTTPALIWTNTALRIPEMPPEVSPQAVVAATLRTMNIQHPFFTGMLGALLRDSPAFSPELVILPNGQLHQGFPDTLAFRSYERLERPVLEHHNPPRQLFPEGPR